MRWQKSESVAEAFRSSPALAPAAVRAILACFGYDPLEYVIGRGALEATGIGFKITDRDVAVRCNFCTIDAEGNISDRRAGRIATELSVPLVEKLRAVKIDGIEIFVEPVKEHRFVVVFRGEGLCGDVHDTDPQVTGVPPLTAQAVNVGSERTAKVANEFISQARELLADQPQANGLTMRGFSRPA